MDTCNINNISWVYFGKDKRYHIFMDGEELHSTPNEYERDMFIAELKARINIIKNSEIWHKHQAFIKDQIYKAYNVPPQLLGKS